MLQQIIMALGAGVASAALFIVPTKQSLFAMLLGVIAPLPMMIVALGLGERYAALAALVGAVALAIAADPASTGVYLVVVALPSLVLPFMARRPTLSDTGLLTLAGAGLAALLGWLGLAAVAVQYASLDAAMNDLVDQLAPIAANMLAGLDMDSSAPEARQYATWVVLAMAPVAAAWTLLGLAGNLWLAGRVAEISGMLGRPWVDVPSTLRLPKAALAIFGLFLAGCALPGVSRVVAATGAAALYTAYIFQGLARLHTLTRGWQARAPLLTSYYALSLFLFPWPLLIAGGLGLADAAQGLRANVAPPPLPKN